MIGAMLFYLALGAAFATAALPTVLQPMNDTMPGDKPKVDDHWHAAADSFDLATQWVWFASTWPYWTFVMLVDIHDAIQANEEDDNGNS